MPQIIKFALLGAIVLAALPARAAPERTLSDRIEMLDWSDPDQAARLVAAAPTIDRRGGPDLQMLEVRGMVYADVNRDSDVDATLAELAALIQRGVPGASAAAHYVRAYSLYQREQFGSAGTELDRVDTHSLASDTERYRFWLLRGNASRKAGQAEAALPNLERALDLAREMHDDLRTLHATLWLARLYLNTGNFDRSTVLLDTARVLALQLGDEAALVEVEGCVSDVADRRGDHAEERRASLAALDHAKSSGSRKWLTHALANLGDSYLKSGDFAESLKYSRQASPAATMHHGADEKVASFNEGLAYIGLGNLRAGEKLVSLAIDAALAGDNVLQAKDMLREYADALERSGYLMMALQVHHRYDDISEKSMTDTRQRAFLELSAKFDNERRAREVELLRRDNALNAAEMETQRLRLQLLLAVAVFIACICVALVWAIGRVRRANDRLRDTGEHDALTGLCNRRYFNDRLLGTDGVRPAQGCVLLADLDFFKRINDTWGHPAGDAVLRAVSRRLVDALRESDTLLRWGGEEFLGVMTPITAPEADATVERLLLAIRRDPVVWNGQSIQCSISIGFACFPLMGSRPGLPLDQAISLVDKALYEAKQRGRDRACRIDAVNAGDRQALTILGSDPAQACSESAITVVELGAAA